MHRISAVSDGETTGSRLFSEGQKHMAPEGQRGEKWHVHYSAATPEKVSFFSCHMCLAYIGH